jgi:DNA topoisomerase-1
MVVRSGRFGPYVTDGEVNASLRRGDDPESLTAERAAELLAEKRAAGPAPPRKGGRSTKATKKGAAKKGAAKKVARTTAATKKAATKKTSGTKKVAATNTAPTKKKASARAATRSRS